MRTKEDFQKEAIEAIEKNPFNSIVVAATGVGKSKIAIDYIKKLKSMLPDLKVLIVVPTERLRDNGWKEEFEKWEAITTYETSVERVCYKSIDKISKKKFDLVVLDELQNITENNFKFFEQNKINEILGLTATLPTEYVKINLLQKLNLKVVTDINIETAVNNKLISPFEVTVIETYLDNEVKYLPFGSKKNPVLLTEQIAYNKLTKDLEYATMSQNYQRKLMLTFQRMRVINNSISKSNIANWILENVIPKEDRTLIFCGSIKQAEELCEHTYHSKSFDTDLNNFIAEKINRLSCVQALNEGHNLPNINSAVITQVTSKERHLIQRIGRTVRYRENYLGQIYITVLKDTVDEGWLNNALSDIPIEIRKLDFQTFKNFINYEN